MKLYKYGKCLMCLGTGRTWYNRACPYCDEGVALHEVTTKSIKAHVLQSFDKDDKKELLELLEDDLEKETE